MADECLNEYERLRQENIRNEALLGSLHRKADELSAIVRLANPKRAYHHHKKPPKAPTGPVHSSLRSRGVSRANLPPDLRSTRLSPSLASSILGAPTYPPPPEGRPKARVTDEFDAGRDMALRPAHVRKVVPWSILCVRVLPLADRTVVAAGDKMGNVGFWDIDGGVSEGQDGDGADGVFRYWLHQGPVSAFVAHQVAPHKVTFFFRLYFICD